MKDKKSQNSPNKNTNSKKDNKQIIIDINQLENIYNTNKFLNTLLNKTFIIKDNEIRIECKCNKKYKDAIKDLQPYSIFSMNEAFELSFTDENGYKSNNTVYINEISKTPELSGSSIIKTITKFITKFINIKQIILQDASTIKCNKSPSSYSLTLFSLITTQKTFYGKYNYELYPNLIHKNKINKIIDKCVNFKICDILKEFNLLLTHSKINVSNSKKNVNKYYVDYYNNFNDDYPYLIGIINILQNIKNQNITFKDLLLQLKNDRQCTKISFIFKIFDKFSKNFKFSTKYTFLNNIKKIINIINNIELRIYYTKNNVK
jgi:hypothetical protein